MAEISNRAVATAAGGALLAVALAFVSPSEGDHRTDYDEVARCASKTVRAVQVHSRTSEATVFTKLKDWGSGDPMATTYACRLRGGPVARLDSPLTDEARDLVLAGRWVAYDSDPHAEAAGPSHIEVVDLKEARTEFSDAAMPDAEEAPAQIHAIVLKRNGSVAWLAEGESGEQGVWKADRTGGGRAQRLDAGPPEISMLSFRLSPDRRRVQWLKDDPGTPHTVTDDTPRSAPID
jgi:hypothetical protein